MWDNHRIIMQSTVIISDSESDSVGTSRLQCSVGYDSL